MKCLDTSKIKNFFLILLTTGVIASITIAIVYVHSYNSLQKTVTGLCADAMVKTELTLRQDAEIDPEPLYQFDEITSIYPSTYYKKLAEALLPLTDADFAQQLSQEERLTLADCVLEACGTSPNFKELMGIVNTIMSKYRYSS